MLINLEGERKESSPQYSVLSFLFTQHIDKSLFVLPETVNIIQLIFALEHTTLGK